MRSTLRWKSFALVCAAVTAAIVLQPQYRSSDVTSTQRPGFTLTATTVADAPLPMPAASQSPFVVPVAYAPNEGQWDADVRFAAEIGDVNVRLGDRGWTLGLARREPDPAAARCALRAERSVTRVVAEATVRMTFRGAREPSTMTPEGRLAGIDMYFAGDDPARWRTAVPRYAAVRYDELYAGVDVRAYSTDGHFEYDVLLEPWADIGAVEVAVDGVRAISVDDGGGIVFDTAAGLLRQPAPSAFVRTSDGGRRRVRCVIEPRGTDAFGFQAPDWDGASALEVDPGLIYSTTYSGQVFGVAIDVNGVVTFGTLTGVLVRVNPSLPAGQQLVWTASLSGATLWDLFLEPGGAVVATGRTTSGSFPTTVNAYDRTFNGNNDVFITRLDPSLPAGQQLTWSTFLGGSGMEWGGYGVFVEPSGVVAVCGSTESANFPITPGAFDSTFGAGGQFGDGFVSVFDPSLAGTQQLLYSTFVGGAGSELLTSIRGGDLITVAGWTTSPDFPTTANAWDRTLATQDVFITQLRPALPPAEQLAYSTYFGGSGTEGNSPRTPPMIDAAGTITVAGSTNSADLPTTPGSWDRTYHGGTDAFVARLDPSRPPAGQLIYATYLGGAAIEEVYGSASDLNGMVTLGCITRSQDCPTTPNAFDSTFGGGVSDAYVARINPTLAAPHQLTYGSYLGGNGSEEVQDMALARNGSVVVGGRGSNATFPVTPTGTAGLSGFVTVMDVPLTFPNEAPTAQAGADQAVHAGATVHLDGSASFDDNTSPSALLYAWALVAVPPGSTAVLSGASTPFPSFVVDIPGDYAIDLVVTDEEGASSDRDQVVVSSFNVAPTASAGLDQLTILGNVTTLDGTGSFDPDQDPIVFAWVMTSRPTGSLAFLANEMTATPSFAPDVEGTYTISLMVSDIFTYSAVDEVVVTAITGTHYAENVVTVVAADVLSLPPASVTNVGNQTSLNQFLSNAVQQMQSDRIALARRKLEDALARVDGCALRGQPDTQGPGRDWVTDCEAQALIYAEILAALNALAP